MARISRRTQTGAAAVAALGMVGLTWAQIAQAPSAAPLRSAWTWSPFLDAVQAAPKSHRVLIDNERVRVLEVVLQPGQREPVHTHEWPGVMYVTSAAPLRYFSATLTNGKWVERAQETTTPTLRVQPQSSAAATVRGAGRPACHGECREHAVSGAARGDQERAMNPTRVMVWAMVAQVGLIAIVWVRMYVMRIGR